MSGSSEHGIGLHIIYYIFRKVPCSDVQPRENGKAVAWNPCNAVHLRILLHVLRANPCIAEFWADPCKSVQGGSGVRASPCNGGSMLAMGSVVP